MGVTTIDRREHRPHVEALELPAEDGVAVGVLDVVNVPLGEREGEVEPGPGLGAGVHAEVAVKVASHVLGERGRWHGERADERRRGKSR